MYDPWRRKGKLTEASGYVRMTLDELEGIRCDPFKTENDWQSCGIWNSLPEEIRSLTVFPQLKKL